MTAGHATSGVALTAAAVVSGRYLRDLHRARARLARRRAPVDGDAVRAARVGRSRRLDARSEGRVSATEEGARPVMRMELRPKGTLRLLRPILGRFMHKQQERNLAAIGEALEASGAITARRGA
jgi:hypothetical protein